MLQATRPEVHRGATRDAPPRYRRIAGQPDTLGRDLCDGFRAWPMWSSLGWQDIRQRYRRSVIGPLWITLSMGLLVGTLGVLYSRVFHTDINTYLPFLCLGFVIWGFLSSTANECCMAFIQGANIIKQGRVPFSIHVLRARLAEFHCFRPYLHRLRAGRAYFRN
jgi:ABC-type polysaccharide/polyol phosphate export permease